MKKPMSIAIISLTLHIVVAQQNGIKDLRYDDEFQYLRDSTGLNIYEKTKFIPLNDVKSSWLSLGGEFRNQYQIFKDEEWGTIENDHNGFILSRMLFHSDLHLNDKLRFFVQFKSNSIQSREIEPKRIEVNAFDVHQFFIDYNLPIVRQNLKFRAGRQEIKLGSQRLVTVREGPNNRLAFDGIRTTLTSKNAHWDAFYLHPVIDKPDILDDNFNYGNKIYGLYVVFNKVKVLQNIDVYYVGAYNKTAVFNGDTNNESRNSLGTRIWKNSGKWTYDFEGVVQFGQFGNQHITAYTASLNTTYFFNTVKFKPQLGLKTEMISGDRDPNDNKLNSFNPLYPRGAYFGLAALIGPVNLIDIHPYFDLNIAKKLTFGADYDWFWRYSINDGIYGPNVRPIYNSQNATKKFIGGQLGIDFNYEIADCCALVLEGTWFNTGGYLKEVSPGKDIWFSAFTIQVKY